MTVDPAAPVGLRKSYFRRCEIWQSPGGVLTGCGRPAGRGGRQQRSSPQASVFLREELPHLPGLTSPHDGRDPIHSRSKCVTALARLACALGHAHVYVAVCVPMYACTCVHMCTRVHMHTCVHLHAHTCVHAPTHMCAHVCTHVHMHIRTHTHTHAHADEEAAACAWRARF